MNHNLKRRFLLLQINKYYWRRSSPGNPDQLTQEKIFTMMTEIDKMDFVRAAENGTPFVTLVGCGIIGIRK
jgi:hypothetical protein